MAKADSIQKSNRTAGFYLFLFLLIGWILAQWFVWRAAEQNIQTAGRHPLPQPVRDLEKDAPKGTIGDAKLQQPSKPKRRSYKTDDFYIVFSTDCSGYQHWQGILLYYSALRVNQPGTIVRLASGCLEDQQTAIAQEWKRIDPTQQKFQVHFAPSTALPQSSYKYSNKPGGLLHWLQHTPLTPTTVVCLLDPDMILLKPITPHLVTPSWTKRPHGKKQIEYVNEQGIAELLRVKSLPNVDNLPSRVTTGHAAGQHFGVGGAWTQSGTPSARPVWQNFSKALVCGTDGACTTTTSDDAAQKYGVGPVYMATVEDWHRIASTWWEFMPRVHQQYPHLLAEMYALTMAVAHLQIPFSLFSSYMVTGSEVDSPTEAWSWIDDIVTDPINPLPQACPGVSTNQPPPLEPNSKPLPNTLHHCQRFKLDLGTNSFLFAKRKIPHDVFSCKNHKKNGLSPVPFDVRALIQQAAQKVKPWSKTERRTLFALCHAVSILNWARTLYIQQVCSDAID